MVVVFIAFMIVMVEYAIPSKDVKLIILLGISYFCVNILRSIATFFEDLNDEGFQKELELIGVGDRAQLQGKKLVLNVGYSHPVEFTPEEGIEIEVPSNTKVIVKGYDKQKVGELAANIRGVRPPEPYKGKGIRYVDEFVRRKEGKTGK